MLYYKATAGCGVGGLWSRCASGQTHHPVSLILGRAAAWPHLMSPAPVPALPVARSLAPSALHPHTLFRCPAPPFVILHVPYPYRIRTLSSLRPSSFGRLIIPARLAHSSLHASP